MSSSVFAPAIKFSTLLAGDLILSRLILGASFPKVAGRPAFSAHVAGRETHAIGYAVNHASLPRLVGLAGGSGAGCDSLLWRFLFGPSVLAGQDHSPTRGHSEFLRDRFRASGSVCRSACWRMNASVAKSALYSAELLKSAKVPLRVDGASICVDQAILGSEMAAFKAGS